METARRKNITSRISKLVLAAAIAATLPAAALACDHDGPRRDEAAWPAPWRPAPEPAHRWREAGWREREREAYRVRAELQALESERAAFHERFAWNPWKLRRYDRSYLERRAALERRRSELAPIAWR